MFKAHPHLQRIDQIAAGRCRPTSAKLAQPRRHAGQGAVRVADRRLLPDQSDRAGVRRDGRMLGDRGRKRRADGGGIDAMVGILDRIWSGRSLRGARAERAAARHPADRGRLHHLCRPQDLGGGADPARPQRGRSLGAAAVVRRPAQIRGQGAGHPGRRQQGHLPAGAARHLRAGARGLGGDPGQRRLGDRQHQCRHPLHLRDLLARRVRHHHGRLGVELEISVPGGAALGGADGVVRSLDRLRDHHRAALRRLAQPVGDRRGAGRQATACSAGSGCRCCRCS